MYYPNQLRAEYPAHADGLRIIRPATSIRKLTATSYEIRPQTMGPAKAMYVSLFIRRGPFRGMGLYVATLEELTTCPDSCGLKLLVKIDGRARCYGANMPFAIRYAVGPGFFPAVDLDLDTLSNRTTRAHRPGFVVRLHELGDFPNHDYIDYWVNALEAFPLLHIFGYSHHVGAMADHLDDVWDQYPGRFIVRDSDGVHGTGPRIPAVVGARPGFVPCPQQRAQTPSCITCGLCMNNHTPISFDAH